MKTLTLLAVALVAWSGLVGCTTTQRPTASAGTDAVVSPQDEAAVRATLAELANTWNHNDMKAMRELLTEDVVWIIPNGNAWRGKQEVYDAHDYLHRILNPKTGKPSMGTLNIENIEVRSMTPQVAVVVAMLVFTNGVGETEQEYPAWGTRGSFVMANRGGAWKIAHYHESLVKGGLFLGERIRSSNSAKRERIKAGVEHYRKEGKDPSAIAELLQEADRLTKIYYYKESEVVLDKALGLLGGTAGETAQPQPTAGTAKPREQDRKHPAEIAKIASVSPTFPVPAVRMGFQNNSSGIRKVYWLDQKGERQLRRELEPGQGYVEPSDLFNPWVVTDADGNALGLYFSDGQRRIVTLE